MVPIAEDDNRGFNFSSLTRKFYSDESCTNYRDGVILAVESELAWTCNLLSDYFGVN
ncbi:hypothetical protein RchiOBHm_Chr6g0309281 [Rosa chinensis]|uniref:Uncharacterized protein n=1 Tax=Rosa chinensis TaxID=74649 RepID=A0A2P6Q0U5_ROSCH|nr:hypothetical protein RchiOBHm_Chr6g0309281 [Rosa chinensis]